MKFFKKKISIIGLGYVGLPTFLVLSNVKKNKKYLYRVEGIEKNDSRGRQIQRNFYDKKIWIKTNDKIFSKYLNEAFLRKDVYINTDLEKIKESNVVLVSVNFDFANPSNTSFQNIKNLSKELAMKIKKKTLIIFETTLPPGTCDKIVLPVFRDILRKRKINIQDIYFCYSFERVMPGKNYINSIISNFRCYSGINKQSKTVCKKFLKTFIDYKKYKLTEFEKIIDCETAKILENSYRAANIALIDEWTKVSKIMNVDLNSIIKSIKLRKTHSNMMWPGLGVGGYCLTKDPYFIKFATKNFFKKKINFPMISNTLKINKNMVKTSINYLISKIKTFNKKRFLICGATYKEDTSDIRFSPSIELIKKLKSKGGKITIYDPHLESDKLTLDKVNFTKNFKPNFDIIIFCVAHEKFKQLSFKNLKKTLIFDLNRVLTDYQKNYLRKNRINYFCLGTN